MANNLQETIEGICKTYFPIGKVIASNEELDEPLTKIVNHEANKAITEATEAILQAVRDVVPEAQKDYNGKELSTDFDNYEAGYNQCRLDILKELGGGNE